MKKLIIIFAVFLCVLRVSAQDSAIDSLKNLLDDAPDTVKIEALITLARIHLSINLMESVDYATQALELARSIESTSEGETLILIGGIRYYQANYDKALEAWLECIEVLQRRITLAQDSDAVVDNKDGLALLYNNVGLIYKTKGEYDKAIEYYQKNLKIQEEIGRTLNKAMGMSNIANVYYVFAIDYSKAMDYYKQSLELFIQYAEENADSSQETIRAKQGVLNTYMNIGGVYREQDDSDLALENYRKAIEVAEELGDKPKIADVQSRIAMIYLDGGSYQEGLEAGLNALQVYREVGQRKEEAIILEEIGTIYFRWGRYQESLEYYNQSLVISQELNLKKEVYDVYREISDVHSALGNYKEALADYTKFVELKDSSIREENLKQINELETKYETERVESQNAILEATNAAQEADIRRQRLFLFGLIAIAIIILGFGSFAYRQYRAKKKANILLNEQNIEIKQQRDQIFQQKQEITDSIHYASRIQNAVLPREELLSKLSDHFILFKPRDIVSGDYYWMTEKDGKTFVLAADCTGHGVPGAFMSMLGISFMNEIVNKSDHTEANIILNQLRANVVQSLHQRGEEGEQKDGMDLALCVIDVKLKKIQYAGAYNPLIMIRNGEMIEYKADKMPIGIYAEKDHSFTNNEIEVQKGDNFYMFSDGYVDQFGGPKAKKFMSKNFKELLLSICPKTMKEQREILDRTIEEWRGQIEQIDDILVMGFRI